MLYPMVSVCLYFSLCSNYLANRMNSELIRRLQRKHTELLSMWYFCLALRWGRFCISVTGSWLGSWVWKRNFALRQLPSWILQSSESTLGSRREFSSKIWPFHPLKPRVGAELVWALGHAGVFRQWMVMTWVASELSKWRKFIWTLPTPNSN